MKRSFLGVLTLLALVFVFVAPGHATNGDNLIGIGPISRSMGGVGVAAPQDAISAVFANPAAMCFGPFCPGSEATFGGTYFDPTVTSKIDLRGLGFGISEGKSRMPPFIVPAIGITSPISERLRFGIGAYGFSGMGVDYKEEGAMYQNAATGDWLYTKLEVMKFAPNLAYLVTPDFSIGASVSIDYGNLDLGTGSAHDYAYGLQLGALYRFGIFNFGASYVSPQKVKHEKVANFDADAGSTTLDTLELEAPQSFALGIAVQATPSLLVEVDGKWYNWSDADGYDAFDWEDQWVFAIGAQYRIIPNLALRAGFNYGKSPVKEHNDFNPGGRTTVQGVSVSNLNYEILRVVGFPAIVEKHLTLGLGYDISEKVGMNFSYMHAFEEKMSESAAGGVAYLESTLEEDSFSFSLTWRF